MGPRILARNRALLRLLSPGQPGAPTLCIVGPVQRTSFVRPPTALLILSYERQPDGRLVTAPLSLCIVGPVEQTSRVQPSAALLILSYERQPDGRLVTAPLSLCIVGPVEQTSRVQLSAALLILSCG